MEKKDQLNAVAKLLKDYFNELQYKRQKETGVRYSQADWAYELEVDPTGLSNWMGAKRTMDVKNAVRLAGVVGPVLLEVLGLPALMPDDPIFREVARLFFKVDDEGRRKVLEILNEHLERNK